MTLELCRRLFDAESVYSPLYWYGYYSRRLLDDGAGGEKTSSLRGRLVAEVRKIPLLKRFVRKVIYTYGRIGVRTADLYWEPNHVVMDCFRARRVLVTVHDLSCMLHPQWHPGERLEFFAAHFARGLERADRIVTVSNAIRGEVVEHLRIPEDRVSFVHNGVDHGCFRPLPRETLDRFRREKNLPERFVLCVGSIEPRKNLLRLLEAWGKLPPAVRGECALLLIGGSGWKNADIMKAIRGSGESVRWLGYVPERELACYYGLAELFVYPSLYEGFGLPPLEAMACGTPVLVSDIPTHREVCGDAATYVTPHDAGKIAEALEALLCASRSNADVVERAALFDWDRSAEAYARIMRSLL